MNHSIIYIGLFSILGANIALPPSNIENWQILYDRETWIGWKNDGQIDWCRTKSTLNAAINSAFFLPIALLSISP